MKLHIGNLKIKKYILFFVLLLVAGTVMAKSKKFTIVPKLTPEEEQQFKYYFYEAERLINSEEYQLAYNLLTFCYTLNPNDPMVNLYIGTFLDGLKQKERALPYFRTAYEKDKEDLWSQYTIALFNSGDPKNQNECIKILESIAKEKKNDPEVWESMKQAYMAAGKYKKAYDAQEQKDKINGYDAYSALDRYRIHVLMKKPKLAIDDINHYLKEDPSNLQFMMFRLQLYEYIHVPQDTLYNAYEQILALDPYNALVLNNYAYHLATHNGDLHKAEQMSQIAVKLEGENATYLDTYAWILYLQGQKTLAEFYIRRAVGLLEEGKIPDEIKEHLEAITK